MKEDTGLLDKPTIPKVYRDWPDGRGLYSNVSNTFKLCVNQHEHLAIISEDKKNNLQTTFGRFCEGLQQLETELEFLYDPSLGYVVGDIGNLGKN